MSIRISGMNSGMDTDSMIQDLMKAYSTKKDNIKKEQTKYEWKQDTWKGLNKKIKSFYTKYAANMQYSTYYNAKTTTVSDSTKASVVASDNAVVGSQTLEVDELAKSAYLTGGKLADGTTSSSTLSELGFSGSTTITINQGKKDEQTGTYSKEPITFDVTGDTKISDVVNYLQSAGLNASFDETNGRFFVSAKNSGADNNFSVVKNDATEALGLTFETASSENKGKMVNGQNAKIKLNGVDYESNSNTFSINGLTITAKEKTTGEISISTDTDYDAIYDKIKSFVKDYSELINEMDKLYNAASSKGYEPLTSEEKEALSDEEVEKWETKIKDSLLRGDSNLSSISNILKSAMQQTYDYNGKTYSLSSFGIETLGYFDSEENERNAYHIAGNEDDDAVSGKADKLKAAIATDPDAVTNFFTKLTKNMYDKLSEFSKSTSNRSYGSFYDDKQMTTEYEKYDQKISDYEDYMNEIEDRYVKQFTAMETAMGKLNSLQSSMSGLFGS